MSLSRPPTNHPPPPHLSRHPSQNNNPPPNFSRHQTNRQQEREPPLAQYNNLPPNLSRHQTNREGGREPIASSNLQRLPTQNQNPNPPPNLSRQQTNREERKPSPTPILKNVKFGATKPISRKITSNNYFRKATNKIVGGAPTIMEENEENLNQITGERERMLMALTAGNSQGENQLISEEEAKEENFDAQLKSFYDGFGKEKLKVENVLSKDDLEKSKLLKDVFQAESPKSKIKIVKSKVFNTFKDCLEEENGENLEANAELQNFIINRQYKKEETPLIGQSQIYNSQYITTGANSGYKSDILGLTSNLKSLNNEDVKKYLQGLDNYLANENIGRIKEGVQDRNKQEIQGSELNKASLSQRYEKVRSSRLNKDLKGGFHDNEELIELRSYYFNEDDVPFWINSKCLNEKYLIGEKLCPECEEFIDPENAFDHYGECQLNIENAPLKRINNRIEKMKNLIIYNYKNSQKSELVRTTDQELEDLMNMGIPIINHIILTNRAKPKLDELIEDLNKLINNLPTLRNKNLAVFLVLLTKVVQLSNIKGQTIAEKFLKKKEIVQPKEITLVIPSRINEPNL